MNLPRVIGLKGGSGAGKSIAAEYFIDRGYRLIRFSNWAPGFGHDFWVDQWREEVLHSRIVIDDCRFPGEAWAIRKLGGVVIEIRRPEFPGAERAHIPPSAQAWEADMRILNEGFNKDILFARIEGALEIWLEEQDRERESPYIPEQIRA